MSQLRLLAVHDFGSDAAFEDAAGPPGLLRPLPGSNIWSSPVTGGLRSDRGLMSGIPSGCQKPRAWIEIRAGDKDFANQRGAVPVWSAGTRHRFWIFGRVPWPDERYPKIQKR
jgi:hypothetical protein